VSTNTSVLIGVYLECTMSKQQMLDSDPSPKCTKNVKHHVGYDAKFCSKCGASVERAPKMIDQFVSLHDILNGNIERHDIAEEVLDEVMSEFDPIMSEWVGNTKGNIDLVGYNMDRIEADHAGMHALPNLKHGYNAPSQDLIDKLIAVAGYTKVTIKYGALVEVA
jgi:hypothetical protein